MTAKELQEQVIELRELANQEDNDGQFYRALRQMQKDLLEYYEENELDDDKSVKELITYNSVTHYELLIEDLLDLDEEN